MQQSRTGSQLFRKSSCSPGNPFTNVQNLTKKRPSTTKLDLEKMYEESLELSSKYKALIAENKELKEQYQRVEAIKHNRQNLIASIQKIVAQKSLEIKTSKTKTKPSWLVFNLKNKINQLKAKIQNRQKSIEQLQNSPQSLMIRQKQTQIQNLNKVIEKAHQDGTYRVSSPDNIAMSDIKEIVWMQQEIQHKQQEIQEAEAKFKREEQEVQNLMQNLANKRAELKSLQELSAEYTRAQEIYKEEKRKKEQRIAGNKTYLQELQHQKTQQKKKLEMLKAKFSKIQTQEQDAIKQLQNQLQKLRQQHIQRIKAKTMTIIKFSEQKSEVNNKKQVKRVTYQQVRVIAGNINQTLALKSISHDEIASYFTAQEKQEYSISQVKEILHSHPFSVESQQQALLLARYTVQDAGDGYFLEDMDTSQSASIIRSILAKLIGEIKIFSQQETERLIKSVGPVLAKFGKLVQQSIDLKEGITLRQTGKITIVTKEQMVDALENSLSSLQNETFLHQQIDFTILYLFSWSRDLDHLQVKRLFTMVENGINWPKQ